MSNENAWSGRTHWWDHYYVRYFVGAIFGAALLLWLQEHSSIRIDAHEVCGAMQRNDGLSRACGAGDAGRPAEALLHHLPLFGM